ncbi:MAG: hypothetical protein ABIP90_07670, partial [Vicinamibacterales bacterium]
MTTARWTVVCSALCAAIFVAAGGHLLAGRADPAKLKGLDLTMSAHAQRQAPSTAAVRAQAKAKESPDEIIQGYCVDCHNDVTKPGGLS